MVSRSAARSVRRIACFGLTLLCWQLERAAAAQSHDAAGPADPARVQRLVDQYLPRLGMTARVAVAVVPRNELMMSVERVDAEAGFRLSVEDTFLRGLTDDELSATVAHELGHVWIFTHHPYLQTEAGANDVAMRLVPKDRLERVYEKVYQRLGTKGTLARFVGD